MARILVVEDEADAREILCRIIENAGYEVACTPNGREALASIINDPPDLIVTDLFMPELDGGGLLEVIRSYLRLQSLPVIILTGLPNSPIVKRARHLRVNSILVKGKATPDEIIQTIRRELHRVPS